MNGKELGRLGGFRLLESLKGGEGSQGRVFRAICEEPCVPGVEPGEIVALKSMPEYDSDGKSFLKLQKRMETLLNLQHPNIIRYRGCFSAEDAFSSSNVVVMDLLEGESLAEKLKTRPTGFDVEKALQIVFSALSGLAAAERAGIIHRDIKPGNIFICKGDVVKLIDFEIARNEGASISTASGLFAGSFDYMAPEFVDPGFRGDSASDVFSMGVVLHEVLTGVKPYTRVEEKGSQADFAFLSRWNQRQEGKCAIHVKSVVKKILYHADEVLRQALAEDRDERYANASEFLSALKKIRFKELLNEGKVYRLLHLVGTGGFGEVFKARVRGQGKLVAVKHMRKSSYGERFRREANVMRRLNDRSFVRFYDYFEVQKPGGCDAFLVMDFLPGMPGASLRDAIRQRGGRGLPRETALQIFEIYARGLSLMHGQGIFHRDIKPANLYCPVDAPERAAIMDLGIARDVNGTLTTGQLPGTLDYMPPEVATVPGYRGDAGMDIWALGLCLYETLTGKMAYPRLPTGLNAIEAFYERARAQIPPNLSDPAVASDPMMLELLRDMTNVDHTKRLQDAEAVRRRLEFVRTGAVTRPPSPRLSDPPPRPAVSRPCTVPPSPGTVLPKPFPVSPDPQPHTASINGFPPPSVHRPIPWTKIAVMVLLVAGIGKGLHISWYPLCSWVQTEWNGLKKRFGSDVVVDLVEQEKLRVDALLDEARVNKAYVESCYATNSAHSLIAADMEADRWWLKWKRCKDVEEVLSVASNDFAVARNVRIEWEKSEEFRKKIELARTEAQFVIDDYGDSRKAPKDTDQRRKEWDRRWIGAVPESVLKEISVETEKAKAKRDEDDRKRKILEDEEKRRRVEIERDSRLVIAEANGIASEYGNASRMESSVDAGFSRWQIKWKKYVGEDFFQVARSRIEAARKERTLEDSSKKVAAECDRWLANIENVTVYDVKNWRSLIEKAALALSLALREGRITVKTAEAVRRRIDAHRRWAVGVIDNKTHHDIKFGEYAIPSVSRRTVVFRNGVPPGVAVLCENHEPLRIAEDRFDSAVTVVSPRQLTPHRSTARVQVPETDNGVVCLIDGVQCRPGVVKVKSGRLHVVYRNGKETYPGVRDFKDQVVELSAEANALAKLPPPCGEWEETPEFAVARKNDRMLSRAHDLVDRIKVNLAPEPVSTRRERLEQAYGLLHDWTTAQTLAAIGEGVERELQKLYQAEKERVRGIVVNKTHVPAVIRVDGADIEIPAGKSALITFEKLWPGDAYVKLPDYEFVFLPRAAADFDGKEFVVDQGKLVPCPVAVSIPPLGEGVTCTIGGKKVSGKVELRPGRYICVYSRPDCVSQSLEFEVRIGEDLTLASPVKWEQSSAMSMFSEAFRSFNSGALEVAKRLSREIGTIEDASRRKELEELKQAIELREKLNQR